MCGVIGRINAHPEKRVDPGALRAAMRSIVHRGPDGEGIHMDGHVALGHRRLAIVDRAGGAQPMTNEDGTIWVTFNGEIYNHAELREELRARGHIFVTCSDTEVLVHGWEEWREALPSRLRGMFAFGVWDSKTHTLFVARDRLGKKPLYWTKAGEDFLFASEIKALLAFPDVRRELRRDVFPEYLALRYVPGTDTLFAGIHRLEAGHWLRLRGGTLDIRRYWDVPLDAFDTACGPFNVDEEAERLLDLFQEAVRIRLTGEVPVGVFLSGGIDSTAVTWAMRQERPGPLKSFSVGFDEDSEGELAFASRAAQALGTEHREVKVTSEDFLGALPDLVWHLDEPNADGACIPLMLLSKRAREEVVVVLSGEGADELLGGYGIYAKMQALEQARLLGGEALSRLAGWTHRLVSHQKARKYLHQAQLPLEERYFGVGRGLGDELLQEAFGDAARERLRARFAPYWERSRQAPLLHRMLYADTKIWLPDDLLVKADKMTMAWAIELRVPFLDHVLLENAWRLPPELKLRGGSGKYLLRRALRGKIPDVILDRPKRGFPVPIGRWLRTSLSGALRDTLLASDSGVSSLMGHKLLHRLVSEHTAGQADHTEALYSLWVFETWHRAYLSHHATQEVQNRLRLDALPDASALFGGEKMQPRARKRAPPLRRAVR